MALSSFASYDSPEAPPLGIASTNEGDDNLDDDFDQAEARAAQTLPEEEETMAVASE